MLWSMCTGLRTTLLLCESWELSLKNCIQYMSKQMLTNANALGRNLEIIDTLKMDSQKEDVHEHLDSYWDHVTV